MDRELWNVMVEDTKNKVTDVVSNEVYLRRVGKAKSILTTIHYMWYILKRNCLLHNIIEGKLKITPALVIRRRVQLIDDLKQDKDTGLWKKKQTIGGGEKNLQFKSKDLLSGRILNNQRRANNQLEKISSMSDFKRLNKMIWMEN